jgi:hypothetical protein
MASVMPGSTFEIFDSYAVVSRRWRFGGFGGFGGWSVLAVGKIVPAA